MKLHSKHLYILMENEESIACLNPLSANSTSLNQCWSLSRPFHSFSVLDGHTSDKLSLCPITGNIKSAFCYLCDVMLVGSSDLNVSCSWILLISIVCCLFGGFDFWQQKFIMSPFTIAHINNIFLSSVNFLLGNFELLQDINAYL